MGGDGEHGGLCFVDVRRVRIPPAAVQVDEEDEGGLGGPLVAIGERMVPRQAAGEDGSLVDEVGREVLVLEARGGRAGPSRPDRGRVEEARRSAERLQAAADPPATVGRNGAAPRSRVQRRAPVAASRPTRRPLESLPLLGPLATTST
jgi:hypothetical protein